MIIKYDMTYVENAMKMKKNHICLEIGLIACSLRRAQPNSHPHQIQFWLFQDEIDNTNFIEVKMWNV